jgi:hypothetical protein
MLVPANQEASKATELSSLRTPRNDHLNEGKLRGIRIGPWAQLLHAGNAAGAGGFARSRLRGL